MYVVMFHSVGNDRSAWNRHYLSVSLSHFEVFCRYLQIQQYTSHSLEEWYDFEISSNLTNKKKIVLTFDDGYLDNWVFAYPILKKYGLKGTLFVNPEFVDAGISLRPTLEDVWAGREEMDKLETLGFLNWEEIKAMEHSGVIDVQSHSMSHNFYFSSSRLVDIYEGQMKYDWLAWNLFPEKKSASITEDQRNLIPHGYPIFECGRALALRRYFPDEKLIQKSIFFYNKEGKSKAECMRELQTELLSRPGTHESDQQRNQRYYYELQQSKAILEEKLGKKVNFLCWPGGGYNKTSMQISIDLAYKASTFGSRDFVEGVKLPVHYKRIQRIGMSSFVKASKGYVYDKNPMRLIQLYHARTGNLFLRVLMKLKKMLIQYRN